MNTEQLISPVPTLHPDESGDKALALMEENNFTQLPVVDDDNYIALVLDSDILDWDKPESTLKDAGFLHFKPAISYTAHPFDAMRLAHDMNLSVLPVLDQEQKYMGSITRDGLLKYITEKSGIGTPGGIIVLEIAPRNYTLVEIARICENEDVIIMNTMVHPNENGMLQVTIKLNRSSLEAVVSSFERHSYHVTGVFGENTVDEDVTGKYNLLMNYINM